jgi:RNA polymerase sigma-70 factor (ECF subfamily)
VDRPGFDDFVVQHYESVRRALCVAFRDSERAEELTQEAFARAWRRWDAVSALERPVAWVFVVAVNQGRRGLRHDARPFPVPHSRDGADIASTVATAVSLRAALDELTARQRAAVVLRYFVDLSVSQVADALGCADGTVKSTLHAALARLRVELSEETAS